MSQAGPFCTLYRALPRGEWKRQDESLLHPPILDDHYTDLVGLGSSSSSGA
jgi:hypothetical protein